MFPSIKLIFENSSLPRLEQYMLLEHILQKSRVWLISHQETILTDEEFRRYSLLLERRLIGEPMAYLVNSKEFMGLSFYVNPDVLIPRPETELLVEKALQVLELFEHPKVVDLGTGSGAIAIAIAHFKPDASVWACDISSVALDVAHQNNLLLGTNVNFFQGDWLDAFGKNGNFDLVVSNPPYISLSDPHLEHVACFEPRIALTDEADGLKHMQNIVSSAKSYLKLGGSLWMEHGFGQSKALRMILQKGGFDEIKSLSDLSNIERISGGVFKKID